ncbi:MAG: hypothetical protein ACF8OB_12495 [Phycisphaeraceae bacterium JB051]
MATTVMPPTCLPTQSASLLKPDQSDKTRMEAVLCFKSEMMESKTSLCCHKFVVNAGLNHLTIPLIRTGRTVGSRSISSHFSSYPEEVQL